MLKNTQLHVILRKRPVWKLGTTRPVRVPLPCLKTTGLVGLLVIRFLKAWWLLAVNFWVTGTFNWIKSICLSQRWNHWLKPIWMYLMTTARFPESYVLRAVCSSGAVSSSGSVCSPGVVDLSIRWVSGENTSPDAITFSKVTVSPKSSTMEILYCCLSGLTLGVLSREVVAASDTGEITSSLVTSIGASTGVVIYDVVLTCRPLQCLSIFNAGANWDVSLVSFPKHCTRRSPPHVLKQQF